MNKLLTCLLPPKRSSSLTTAFAGTRRSSSEFRSSWRRDSNSVLLVERPTADPRLYLSLRWIDEWTSEDSIPAFESAEAKKEATSAEVRKSGYEVSYST